MTLRKILGLYTRARINSWLHPEAEYAVYVNSTDGPIIFAVFQNGKRAVSPAIPDTVPKDWSKDGDEK